jgi:deoxyribodipyrimidine photo-lyase
MTDSAASIVWFRNDLRLHDHKALTEAARGGRPVVAAYVLDDEAAGAWACGGASRWWLHHSLAALHAALAERGVPLALRRGDTPAALAALAAETGATEIRAGGAVEPWARALERRVAAIKGVRLHLHRTVTLFDPEEIRTGAGGVYGVFTPFARACRARGAPDPLPVPPDLKGGKAARSDKLADWGLLPRRPDWAGGLRETWVPGEPAALDRMRAFIKHVERYDARRNLPAEPGTSMLSPHLHWGELSAAQLWQAASAAPEGKGRETYQQEILWREFSAYLLWHHPDLPERPLRPEFEGMAWRADAAALRAWQRGRTGVPIVDAGMRQLWRTGWMHNRVRMITASYLVKHLLVPWQDGERWFWDTLVDADLGSNSASWQWVAGCGADAAPFFRVFNPVLQGRKFDPGGAYVRTFAPELAGLDAAHVHAPWEAPADVLARAGVTLGRDYPRPLVDLSEGRVRALAAFKAISRSAA